MKSASHFAAGAALGYDRNMGNRVRMLISGIAPVLALVMTLWLVTVPAAAKTCYKNIVPPGRSGASQYVEVVPTACGGATPPSVGGKGSGSGGSINRIGHGAAGVSRLSHMGAQGKAAAVLAAAGAPQLPSGAAGGAGGAQATGHGGSPAANFGSLPSVSGSGGGALSDALAGSSGSGLGLFLPVLMGILLAAAVGMGVMRARRGGGPSV
jgi:hypothetical protein